MTRNRLPYLVLCSFLLMGLTATAAEEKGVDMGDPAPEFTLLDDQGKEWKSSDYYGKKTVVIYFYPADMTGGCTKQACGFRDDAEKLKEAGVEVIGISGDSVRNHQLFKKAHDLNFTLLADTEGKVAEKFGVPYTVGEKTVVAEIDGQKESLVRNVTTRRWTYVVGKDKTIKLKDENTNAAQDSQRILQFVADN
jgi:thioredoxin-dependent peroxiredoxin